MRLARSSSTLGTGSPDGYFLVDNPRLRRRMLRIARLIEYGGKLGKNGTRKTLIESKRWPKGGRP